MWVTDGELLIILLGFAVALSTFFYIAGKVSEWRERRQN